MKRIILESRLQQGEYVADSIYATGLLRIVQYLFLDLNDLLETEGRRFGIMISYLDSVYNTCKRIEVSQEDDEVAAKIIFLYKPLVIKEFKKLCKKHVSRADSVIVIIHRLLDIIIEVQNFQYSKEARSLQKIITKLFDNIRNRAKNSPLKTLTDSIETYMEQGLVGKYSLDRFSILEEEEKRTRQPLVGSGIRVKKEQSKILEVTWIEE